MANQTKYFKTPFAESGTRAEVPNNSIGGAVGFDTGFGPDYELPQGSAGRKRIERDKYNGLHHSITKNLKQWQEHIYPTWIEDAGSGTPFSYPVGMIVNHTGKNWVSNDAINTEEPGTGIKWSVHFDDWMAFTAALYADAGIVDNGLPDTAIASQRLDAMKAFPKPASSILSSSGTTIQSFIDKNRSSSIGFLSGYTPSSSVTINVDSFHTGLGYGGGQFYWDSTKVKSKHNGGTIVDPLVAFPTDWDDDTQVSTWYTATASTSTGCWVRVFDGKLYAEWFGARRWTVGSAYHSTREFNKVAEVAGIGGAWKWGKGHRVTSEISIPARQTFGSNSVSIAGFRTITSLPENFNGVNTGNINELDSFVFHDATTGSPFVCGEGAKPQDFSVYGRGFNATGFDIYGYVPEASYYETSAFTFGKFIKPSGVSIEFFKYASNSDTVGALSGNYYSAWTGCFINNVWAAFKVSGISSYNTKVYDTKINAKKFGQFDVTVRNFVVYGGSFEGYTDVTLLRESSSLTFYGTYFETFTLNPTTSLFVFRVIGTHAKVGFDECTIYLNFTSAFVRDLSGTERTSIKSTGNEFRVGASNTIPVVAYVMDSSPPYGFCAGDMLLNFSSQTAKYLPSTAAKTNIVYNSPVLFNATE